MQACPNSNCQINAISMNRFYGNYVNKCIHFAGIRVYNVAFVWQTRGQKVYDKLHKIGVFFSTLHFVFGGGNLVRLFDELPKMFLGQMWLVILNNSRALPQICRGAAPICMVVVVVLKFGIGSDPPPLPLVGTKREWSHSLVGPNGQRQHQKVIMVMFVEVDDKPRYQALDKLHINPC